MNDADRGGRATDWAVSIYSSRESPELLLQTVEAAVQACTGRQAVVDLVVNGHDALARCIAEAIAARRPSLGALLRIWSVPLGDKANAWNEYLHRLAPRASTYFFLDGYVHAAADSLAALHAALQGRPGALGATGVPKVGFSAALTANEMRRAGGLHGNLYALRDTAVDELRRLGWRLPLGLYRNDSTLGAALSFGLNLYPREWRALERIALCEQVHWSVPTLSWWRPADLRAHWRRRVRQAQGELELAALRERYSRRRVPFEDLPQTATELVQDWMDRCPGEARALLGRSRFARQAWMQLQQPRARPAEALQALRIELAERAATATWRTADASSPSVAEAACGAARDTIHRPFDEAPRLDLLATGTEPCAVSRVSSTPSTETRSTPPLCSG